MTDTDESTASAAALERYAADLRRRRRVWFPVVGVVLVLVVVLVIVAWTNGEIANTTLRTVSDPPNGLSVTTPSATQQAAWQTSDRLAIGDPQWQGTVVVYSRHTVRGLDARTGAQTWSYTRSDRTTCSAVQAGGTTFAVYMVNGNCDEVTALDSNKGGRRWTRTLDEDGKPLNGRPSISVLSYTVMFTTSSVIYAIDPVSGYDRWTYAIPGCTIERAVLGTAGALISQSCTTPKCGSLRYCAKGPQLLLRDGSQGRDDKSQDNPDHVIWAKNGDTRIPVSADTVISAFTPSSGRLDLLSPTTGSAVGQLSLPTLTGSPATVAVAADAAEVIYLHGVAYAVTTGRDTPLWSLATPGAPTVLDVSGQDDPQLSAALITVPTGDGIGQVDGGSGTITHTFAVSPPPAGSSVRPLGAGFLVASASGTIAYR